MNRVIIDTETTFDVVYKNGKPNFRTGLVYDFGGVVVDGDFNILESFNFVIDDIFNGMSEKMATAYYANKLPAYHVEIAAGVREVVSFVDARAFFINLLATYSISEVWAYNARFDRDSLNYTVNKLSNGFVSEFLPANCEFKCIMGAFKSTLANSRNYFKSAIAAGQVTEAGNVRMTAESAYQHLANDLEFIEAHTALCDAEIEAFILRRCLKQRKKMSTAPQVVSSGNYHNIQRKFKAYAF